MQTAVIIPFVQYNDVSKETSRLLFNFFLKHFQLWKDEVDKVYIIDSGDFISTTEPKIEVIKKPWQSHWQNLNETMGMIKEDAFILMDSDTVIYKPGTIKEIFKKLERNHIVSIMDNSGGDPVEQDYPQLQPNTSRAVRRRFAPYLFGCQNIFWKRLVNPDFTPTQGDRWTDSMGTITRQILSLKPTVEELPDDRTTLYYNKGDFKVSQWLDGGEYSWSQIIKPDYGYYHVRNAGFPLYLADTFLANNEAWKVAIRITPPDELLRLCAWGQTLSDIGEKFVNFEPSWSTCAEISEWNAYIEKFNEVHDYLLGLHE